MTEFRIRLGRHDYIRFAHRPFVPSDGQRRCFDCGQIDEPGVHLAEFCKACGGAWPLSENARAFNAANDQSPVVHGRGHEEGGGTYTLEDGRSFDLTLHDLRTINAPRWKRKARARRVY